MFKSWNLKCKKTGTSEVMHASFSLKILLEQTSCILMNCGVAPLPSCAMSSPQKVETKRHHWTQLGSKLKALQTASLVAPCCHPLAKIALSSPRQASTLNLASTWVKERLITESLRTETQSSKSLTHWAKCMAWYSEIWYPSGWYHLHGCVSLLIAPEAQRSRIQTQKIFDFHVASPPTSPPVAWHVPPKPLGCASGILWRRLSTSLKWAQKKKQFLFSIKTKIKIKSLPLLFFVELRLFFFQKIAIHYICWENRVTGRNSSGSPHRCAYEALHENNGPWPGHPVWNPGSHFPWKSTANKNHQLGVRFVILQPNIIFSKM